MIPKRRKIMAYPRCHLETCQIKKRGASENSWHAAGGMVLLTSSWSPAVGIHSDVTWPLDKPIFRYVLLVIQLYIIPCQAMLYDVLLLIPTASKRRDHGYTHKIWSPADRYGSQTWLKETCTGKPFRSCISSLLPLNVPFNPSIVGRWCTKVRVFQCNVCLPKDELAGAVVIWEEMLRKLCRFSCFVILLEFVHPICRKKNMAEMTHAHVYHTCILVPRNAGTYTQLYQFFCCFHAGSTRPPRQPFLDLSWPVASNMAMENSRQQIGRSWEDPWENTGKTHWDFFFRWKMSSKWNICF